MMKKDFCIFFEVLKISTPLLSIALPFYAECFSLQSVIIEITTDQQVWTHRKRNRYRISWTAGDQNKFPNGRRNQ